jgi:hypothetical protein
MMQKRPCRGLDMRYSSSDRTRDTSASRGSLARAAVKGKCPITSAAHARHPVYLLHLRKAPASGHSARRTYFRKFPVPNSYPLRTQILCLYNLLSRKAARCHCLRRTRSISR